MTTQAPHQPRRFTPTTDAEIVRLRELGVRWTEIGKALRTNPSTVRKHAAAHLGMPTDRLPKPLNMTPRRIRDRERRRAKVAKAPIVVDRWPLPAGHPVSWGAISSDQWMSAA